MPAPVRPPLPGLLRLLLAALLLAGGGVRPPQALAQHTLRDFTGVVYSMNPAVGDLGMGWVRELQVGAFDWSTLQPNRSSPFLFDATDAAVATARRANHSILPILAYTPQWAQQGHEADRCHWPATNVSDWEGYVTAVVERYTAQGVRHWQIWNEPGWPNKPFYCGTEASFVLDIYLPAARIIRAHGGRVVFGGWVSIYGMDDFKELLLLGDGDTTVLEMTDVLDVHVRLVTFVTPPFSCASRALCAQYHGVSELVEMYEWANGTKGMWMSELGFLTFPSYLPNVYLRWLSYAASNGRWVAPDTFVLIWYASWGAGPDAPKCLSFTNASGDQELTAHGRHLQLMSSVFRDEKIKAFDDFTTTPELRPSIAEEVSSALGFELSDGTVVVALLVGNDTYAGPAMTATLRYTAPAAASAAVPSCDMIAAPNGTITPLQPTGGSGGGDARATVEVVVPVGLTPMGVARAFGGPKDPYAVAVTYVVCK